MKAGKHNRRRFFQLSGGLFLAGIVFIWNKMVKADKELSSVRKLTVPFNPNREFTFHKDFILIQKEEDLQVYSSRCTHLGCIIQQAKNDHLICPCHGSTFASDGNPINGPAVKPLKRLNYKLDRNTQQITIEL
jgi:Rieske Fe-S protein